MSTELVYGRHSVYEALKAGSRKFKKILVAKRFEGEIVDKIVDLARKKNIPVQYVDKAKLVGTINNHQGVIAFVSPKEYLQFEKLIYAVKDKTSCTVCILDGIEDPQNLGVIIRNALCFGVDAVIVHQKASAGISSGASKASAGAIEYLPVVKVPNLVMAIEALKKSGFWIYGADMSGETICGKEIKGRVAVVIGSEGTGLRHLTKEKCDFLVKIPIADKISSLNAAVSASIIFYEIVRQKNLVKA
jgi:23S rRNA (guanosine2251-2'-O)-methyltransferase